MSIYLKTATCMPGWRWKSSRWRAIMYLSVMLVMLAWICCLKNALHIKNKFRGFLRHSFCKVLPYSFCNAILGFWFSLILDKQVSERYNILVLLQWFIFQWYCCILNAEIGSNFSCTEKNCTFSHLCNNTGYIFWVSECRAICQQKDYFIVWQKKINQQM